MVDEEVEDVTFAARPFLVAPFGTDGVAPLDPLVASLTVVLQNHRSCCPVGIRASLETFVALRLFLEPPPPVPVPVPVPVLVFVLVPAPVLLADLAALLLGL